MGEDWLGANKPCGVAQLHTLLCCAVDVMEGVECLVRCS